ncbi:hypothetical protein ABT337_01875 [Saccharopolyspora hirsuta]|nr:hypothetical protein [Saccharopolyspora hirsuta]
MAVEGWRWTGGRVAAVVVMAGGLVLMRVVGEGPLAWAGVISG